MADMSTVGVGLLDAGLSIVGLAFPEALPVIAIAKEVVPALIAAEPYIKKAVEDGQSAFAAANAASPDLGGKIEALARQVPMAPGVTDWAAHLDHVTTAATPRFAVQGWTDAETEQWLDHAAPAGNSQAGSG